MSNVLASEDHRLLLLLLLRIALSVISPAAGERNFFDKDAVGCGKKAIAGATQQRTAAAATAARIAGPADIPPKQRWLWGGGV